MKLLIQDWTNFLKAGLAEDGAEYDWTARSVAYARGGISPKVKARLIAKSNGIWAAELGSLAVEKLSQELQLPITIVSNLKDGAEFKKGATLVEWVGTSDAILTFERTFINLSSYLSGIATETAEYVRILNESANNKGILPAPRLSPTRKTLPLYRNLALHSTLVGGAYPHRFNLSGGVLIKENHIEAAKGISNILSAAKRTAPHLLKLEIEVKNLDELKEALATGLAEVIMLDNFQPHHIADAVKLKPKSGVIFEVSGGLKKETLSDFILPGIDVLSVGSLTHSVTSCDFSLLVEFN